MALGLGAVTTLAQGAAWGQAGAEDRSRQADELDELASGWYRQWHSDHEMDTLSRACATWERAVVLRGSASSKEQLRSLSALAQCRLAQGQSVEAWNSIDRACQLSASSGLKLEDVDLVERREAVRRMLPLITLRVSPEAAVPGLTISTAAGPLPPESFEELIIEGEEQLTISADGYVTQTLTVKGATGGTARIYDVPVLASETTPEPPEPTEPGRSSNSLGVGGTIGVLGAGATGVGFVLVVGTALYKTGVNQFACDDGCSQDWSDAKEKATGYQTIGWWTGGIGLGAALIGFGIMAISGDSDSDKAGGASESRAIPKRSLAVIPLMAPQATGIQVNGAF